MTHPRITTSAELDEIDDRHDLAGGDVTNRTVVTMASWEASELVRLARLGLEYDAMMRETTRTITATGYRLPSEAERAALRRAGDKFAASVQECARCEGQGVLCLGEPRSLWSVTTFSHLRTHKCDSCGGSGLIPRTKEARK